MLEPRGHALDFLVDEVELGVGRRAVELDKIDVARPDVEPGHLRGQQG